MLSGVTCAGGCGHSQTLCLPPAHHWGHSQTGVYLIFPSPRGRTHCGVVWPLSGLLAHCQACGAASMRSGVLAGVDPQGAQGQEGQTQLALPLVVSFGRGPVATGGRQTRWRDGCTETQCWAFVGASKFGDRNWFPLGLRLGDGRGGGHLPTPFFPAELRSVFWGSTTFPPGVLSPSHSPSRAVDL